LYNFKFRKCKEALQTSNTRQFSSSIHLAMTQNDASKRIAAAQNNPFYDVNIMRKVITCAGAGQWFFLAPVCKLWRDLYAQLASASVSACSTDGRRRNIACKPQMTRYICVFASASRIRLARESGVKFTTKKFRHAAGAHADTTTLAAAHELGMPFSEITMVGAARCNKLAVLQFLHAEGCPWEATVMTEAVKRGEFEMVRWLHETGCEWDERWVLYYAATSGNIELLGWVKQRVDMPFTEHHMQKAVERGQTAVCEYLQSQQCPLAHYMCRSAARNGHADTLHWLRQQEHYFNVDSVCEFAALGGSVAVLEYLLREGLLATRLTWVLKTAGISSIRYTVVLSSSTSLL
jgi:hypothetical protein